MGNNAMRWTLKAIKAFPATDVTSWPEADLNALRKRIATVAYSCGVYGVTGRVYLARDTGEYFKTIGRGAAHFVLGWL